MNRRRLAHAQRSAAPSAAPSAHPPRHHAARARACRRVAYGDALMKPKDSIFRAAGAVSALSVVYEYRSARTDLNLDTLVRRRGRGGLRVVTQPAARTPRGADALRTHPLPPPASTPAPPPPQSHFDLDWRSLSAVVTQASDSPSKTELTLSLYRTCGTVAELGAVTSTSSTGGASATILRPEKRVLSHETFASSLGVAVTRSLGCVDATYTKLYSDALFTTQRSATEIAAYADAKSPCCTITTYGAPLYRDGSVNPGGYQASNSVGGVQYTTEMFWRVARPPAHRRARAAACAAAAAVC